MAEWEGWRREFLDENVPALKARLRSLLKSPETRAGQAWTSLLESQHDNPEFLVYGILVHLATRPPIPSSFDPLLSKLQVRTQAHILALTNPHALCKLQVGYRKGEKPPPEPINGIPAEWTQKTSVPDLLRYVQKILHPVPVQ